MNASPWNVWLSHVGTAVVKYGLRDVAEFECREDADEYVAWKQGRQPLPPSPGEAEPTQENTS